MMKRRRSRSSLIHFRALKHEVRSKIKDQFMVSTIQKFIRSSRSPLQILRSFDGCQIDDSEINVDELVNYLIYSVKQVYMRIR